MAIVILLFSCSTTDSLQNGEYLLTKNKVVAKNITNKKSLSNEELNTLPFQKPNKKMFGLIPFRLGVYNLVYDKKENKFKWFLKNKIGEPPVIYNENLTKRSQENICLFMFNKGYFKASVDFQPKFNEQKAIVQYSINCGNQYTINSISNTDSSKNNLYDHIAQIKNESLLKVGDPVDINILDKERARISEHLRNMGYYDFKKDYIVFELDTNLPGEKVNVLMSVKPLSTGEWHKRYTINNIYVLIDYNNAMIDSLKIDTVLYNNLEFIQSENKYKYKILANAIFLEEGKYFRLDSYQFTLKKLAGLGTFKFVDIQFKEFTNRNKEYLDTYIYLTSGKKQNISVDLQGDHSFSGFTGTSVSFTYQNKNLSKAADLFELKVSSGVEFYLTKKTNSPLNNADVTFETNYTLNKFLVPFPLKKVSKYNNVKSKFSLLFKYERRISLYSLYSSTFNFGYTWNEASNKKHVYNPISITLFRLPEKSLTESFINALEQIKSLKRSFSEQMIFGSNYTFYYNNKASNTDKSYILFQGKIGLAGNLVHGIVALTKQAKNDTTPYKILKQEYSQFARFEGNVVHAYSLGRHASWNSHFNFGLIIPYGNSKTAPYFQQFYVGGSNSVRAFKLRSLGPGTYADTTNINNPNFFFDQAGDFKLEASTELRFDIYKWFKGAIFMDAGNVWLIRNDPDRPGAKLNGKSLINGVALGTGFGLRLDFDYFVIRTDLSFPIIDPRYSGEDRYPLSTFTPKFGKESWWRQHTIFHLAIGYPF